jgi:GT2 family glycosyltransferase
VSTLPLVTVVVVNWNGRAYLEKCLSSLRAQTYPAREIVLVDNGSTDGSIDFVRERFPGVQIMPLPHNVGFAAGNNCAIREARGAYIALLNNDAYAEPEWLARMVEAAEQHPAAGLVACKLLYAHDPQIINAAGLALDWAGFCWEWRGGAVDDPQESAIEECFGPSGAAALYRRAMLDEIGSFDEDFFAYAEDADLNWRALRAGWHCLYVPQARVYHISSATVGEGSAFKSRLLGRNKVWLLVKNVPGGRYAGWWFVLIMYDLLAVGWGLLSRRDTAAVAGRWAALRSLRAMWRKRRASPTRTNSYLKLLRPLEAPWKISARLRRRPATGK